jgi:hypothetical protein
MSATGLLHAILIQWANATNLDVAVTEVHEATVDNLASATLIQSVPVNAPGAVQSWTRQNLNAGDTRYYWVRHLNASGIASTYTPASATAGWSATAESVAQVIDPGTELQVKDLGLGVASPTGGGQLAQHLGANGLTGTVVQRFTDTAPTGNFVNYETAAGVSLALIDILGNAQAQTYTASQGFQITGAATAGHYLRHNGTRYVDSAIQPTDMLTQMSVAADSLGVRFVGDVTTPGTGMYYGTDSTGTRGYFQLPVSTKQGRWRYSNNTTIAAPSNGNFRWDSNTTITSVTQMALSVLTDGGVDATNELKQIVVGDQIEIQDLNTAADWVRFTVIAPAPTNNTTWFLFHVQLYEPTSYGGVAPSNNEECLFTVVATAGGAAGGAVSSVSNSDGTLIVSPTTGAVITSLALAHANTWTAAQVINLNTYSRDPTAPVIAGGGTAATTPYILQANDNTNAAMYFNGYGTYGGNFIGTRARLTGGTGGTLNTLAAGNIMFTFGAAGYDGTAYSGVQTQITMRSSNLWSTTDHSTYMTFNVTPSASLTMAEAMRINASGGLSIGNTTDKGIGTLFAQGGLYSADVAAMMHVTTAFNGGATGAAPTLTAGPVAGNPTKWIPIDDAGVTRYIPAW